MYTNVTTVCVVSVLNCFIHGVNIISKMINVAGIYSHFVYHQYNKVKWVRLGPKINQWDQWVAICRKEVPVNIS